MTWVEPGVPSSDLGDWMLSQCQAGPDGRRPDVAVVHDHRFGVLHLATSYQAVSDVYTNQALSRLASTHSAARALNGHVTPHNVPLLEGERHAAARAVIEPAFAPSEMAWLRPVVSQMVEEAADDMEEIGAPADLVLHLAQPLPARVVAHLLGLRDADPHLLAQWAEDMYAIDKSSVEVAAANRGLSLMGLRLWRAVHHDATTSPFASRVLASGGENARFDLVNRVADMIVGGCEHTTIAIQSVVVGLLTSGEFGRLRDNPEFLPDAVEELLRIHPAGHVGLPRTAIDDTTVAGCPVPVGATVLPVPATANFDPQLAGEDTRFEVGAPRRNHTTFGLGARHCPGAPAARVELQVVLEVLLRRFPGLSLAVPAEWLRKRRDHFAGGYEQIPLVW